jgi:hypothetical protein
VKLQNWFRQNKFRNKSLIPATRNVKIKMLPGGENLAKADTKY